MKKKRNYYQMPTLDVAYVQLEQGIAASSVMVSGGPGSAPYQPQVQDWEVGGSGYGQAEF